MLKTWNVHKHEVHTVATKVCTTHVVNLLCRSGFLCKNAFVPCWTEYDADGAALWPSHRIAPVPNTCHGEAVLAGFRIWGWDTEQKKCQIYALNIECLKIIYVMTGTSYNFIQKCFGSTKDHLFQDEEEDVHPSEKLTTEKVGKGDSTEPVLESSSRMILCLFMLISFSASHYHPNHPTRNKPDPRSWQYQA